MTNLSCLVISNTFIITNNFYYILFPCLSWQFICEQSTVSLELRLQFAIFKGDPGCRIGSRLEGSKVEVKRLWQSAGKESVDL